MTSPEQTGDSGPVRRRRVSWRRAILVLWARQYPSPAVPETHYTRVGDVHIAYQTLGEGAIDVVLADQWFSHMDGQWDVPPLAELRRRLASFSRLILFDKRGVGLSDPVPIQSLPSIEAWMDDLRAVMDAAGSGQAALITNLAGTMMSLVFAASHPNRLRALVIVDGFARLLVAPDYPFGQSAEELERRIEHLESGWGRGLMLDAFAPSMRGVAGLREAWARYERLAASPGSAQAMVRNISYEIDVRQVLPTIRVPTLVIQHPDATGLRPDLGRFLAEHIAGARYLELPGIDRLIWAGDQARLVAEIEEFITGARPRPAHDRVLATVLFTDIVGSTQRAAEMGDHAWRELRDEHDRLARRAIEAAGGRVIKSTGDGVLATFDGPARGVRAARDICEAALQLGLHLRAGLHTGEIEVAGWTRRAHRVAGCGARRVGRDPRHEHRQGARGWIGYRLRGAWQPGAQGGSGQVAALRDRRQVGPSPRLLGTLASSSTTIPSNSSSAASMASMAGRPRLGPSGVPVDAIQRQSTSRSRISVRAGLLARGSLSRASHTVAPLTERWKRLIKFSDARRSPSALDPMCGANSRCWPRVGCWSSTTPPVAYDAAAS